MEINGQTSLQSDGANQMIVSETKCHDSSKLMVELNSGENGFNSEDSLSDSQQDPLPSGISKIGDTQPQSEHNIDATSVIKASGSTSVEKNNDCLTNAMQGISVSKVDSCTVTTKDNESISISANGLSSTDATLKSENDTQTSAKDSGDPKQLIAVDTSSAQCNGSKSSSNATKNDRGTSEQHSAPNRSLAGQNRSVQSKHDVKPDNFRPLGRLLHDLGLELVREQVYRDLIEIQAAKDANNRLEEREKCQLVKLVEAHERLAARNSPYHLPVTHCGRCNFASSSTNGMVLHLQYGSWSRVDPTTHVCCACTRGHGFRTRSATGFLTHLSEEHNISGRLLKKPANFACTNCPYEHRNSFRIQMHMSKCLKKYPVMCNLQPLPGDCDIALVYRQNDRNRSTVSQNNRQLSISTPAVSGQPSVRTLLNSMRSQHGPSNPPESQGTASAAHCTLSPSVICEICGKVIDGRDALWSHFHGAHHVDISRSAMIDQEPWMKCDVCSLRFWTYQGLSRHLLLAHNRAIAASFNNTNCSTSTAPTPATTVSTVGRCHLCGGSQTANPLSHFSAYHNITLLEMYHAKLCCLCNRRLNSGRAFEEHMVEQHSDIFANYDVLRTVLQALTTARYFKSDENRRASPSHQSPNDTQSMMAVKTMPNTNRYAKSPVKRKRECIDKSEPESLIPVKTEKQATAEEVKKLYEDLADIGRPILRSMRHKGGSSSSSISNNTSNESMTPLDGNVDEIKCEHNEEATSDDIPLKRICDDNTKNADVNLVPAE